MSILNELPNLIISNGRLTLGGGGDTGGYAITFAASTPAQNVVISIPDPGTTGANLVLGTSNVSTITATTAITPSQSGNLFFIASAAAAVAITLPAVASGLRYVFIVSGTLANAVTIGAGSAIILGSVLSSDGTSVTGGAITTAKSNAIIETEEKHDPKSLPVKVNKIPEEKHEPKVMITAEKHDPKSLPVKVNKIPEDIPEQKKLKEEAKEVAQKGIITYIT